MRVRLVTSMLMSRRGIAFFLRKADFVSTSCRPGDFSYIY